MISDANTHFTAVEVELDWLCALVRDSVRSIQANSTTYAVLEPPVLPVDSAYFKFVDRLHLNTADRVALIASLASSYQPDIFIPFLENLSDPKLKLAIGGVVKDKSLRFTPTVRTFLFLLAGANKTTKAQYLPYFNLKHRLITEGVVSLSNPLREQGVLNQEVEISDDYLHHLLQGRELRLDAGANFPAALSNTHLNYEEVVLRDDTRAELEPLIKFIKNKDKLLSIDGIRGKVKTSYVAVFAGLPGTGKTLTAKTIGKKFGMPAYVVNLSRVVSKYIGETEKNLERVFDRFNKQPCILFFDEADALFGKRTEVKDARDRYANQEVAFLLQKVEEFEGVVILATNVQDIYTNFDRAFQRRIRRIIHFNFPNYTERKILWERSLPETFQFESGLHDHLAHKFQLTGANIHNIISDWIIEAIDKGTSMVMFNDLAPIIKNELLKTGRKYEQCTDEMAEKNLPSRIGYDYNRKNF